MVRGATTSATLVPARLRDVEAMRREHVGVPRDGHVGRWAAPREPGRRWLDAPSPGGRRGRAVRALPGLALLEPWRREANASARLRPDVPRPPRAGARPRRSRCAADTLFEADRQVARTSREYADGRRDPAQAGGAAAASSRFSDAAERHRRGDADAAAAPPRPRRRGAARRAAARREAARARLHRLQHAFPGRLAKLCACRGGRAGAGVERHGERRV